MWVVFDNQLCTIRANVDKNLRSKSHGSVEVCHDLSLPTINNVSWRVERFDHPGPSTSLSINETSRRLAMTWLAGSPYSGIAILPVVGIPIDGDLGKLCSLSYRLANLSRYVLSFGKLAIRGARWGGRF